jgi:hypothetical protein
VAGKAGETTHAIFDGVEAMGGKSWADEPTEAELGKIARELREIAHGSSWSRTLATGELVLRHFFGGDIEEWRARRRQKDASIRRLAQRPDCPLAKSALSEAVAVHVAHKELPAFVMDLSPSHLALALRLPAVLRIELLQRAHAASWSVRSMRVEVTALKRRAGERRGRPPSSSVQSAVTHAARAHDSLRDVLELLTTAAASPASEDALAALLETLDACDAEVLAIRERLHALAQGSGISSLRGVTKASVLVARHPASRTG